MSYRIVPTTIQFSSNIIANFIDIVSIFHILKVCAYNSETGSLLTQSPAGPYYIIKNHDDQWGMYKACVLDVEGRALDYYNVITKEMDTCSTYEGSNSGKQKYEYVHCDCKIDVYIT